MSKWLCVFLVPMALWGQPEFFGYYEAEADGVGLSGESYAYGYTKLRLDLETWPTDNIQIGANLNVQQYFGQTTWDLIDFLPENVWIPAFNPDPSSSFFYRPELPYTLPDTVFLDNVYLRLAFAQVDLTVGRQQLSMGTGYAWNPTDIFNTKTLLDPSYEQTGIYALRAQVALAGRLNVDLILEPAARWDQSARLTQVKLGVGTFDVTATAGTFTWERSQFFLPATPLSVEREILGGSLVGELAGFGIWAEGAYNHLASNADDYWEYVIGVDRTLDSGWYLLLEYLRNENAAYRIEELTLDDYFRAFAGETHSLMRDYLFLYSFYPVSDFVTLSLLGFANLSDGSAAVNPGLEWNAFSNTDVSLLISLPVGEEHTEFGLQDWGARLRLRSYF